MDTKGTIMNTPGTEGQDRDNYTDTQDRDNYTVDEDLEELEEPITAEYFATINKGKIVTYAFAVPPHTLLNCQIALTRQEYDLLRAIDGKLDEAARAIKAIKEKVKANGS